jgi:membrane protein DedA with SNARE-associated domain
MIARIAGTVILSGVVFVGVSLLVSLGVLWRTGGAAQGAIIGVICGFLAASIVATVSVAVGRRSGERPRDRHRDENERSGGGPDR